MTVYLIKKDKNRTYKSEKIISELFGKTLVHDEAGAPLIAGPSGEIILSEHVSVSDTKNFWACAFSEKPVGIDVEELSRKAAPNAVKRLHPAEREYLGVLSEGSSEWKEEFLSVWTKKEAYSKYMGKGLGLGFSGFCVLEEWQDSLETRLYTQQSAGLVISATEEFEVKRLSYKAPLTKIALEAGADILDMFGCSAGALKAKLLDRGYSNEAASEAVKKLKELGFLNDRSYAVSIAKKYASKGYSSRRIEAELRRKQIEPALAREIASAYKTAYETDAPKDIETPEESDRARAMRIAKKALGSAQPDDKIKARISRKLSSLGYDTYIIYDTINRLM